MYSSCSINFSYFCYVSHSVSFQSYSPKSVLNCHLSIYLFFLRRTPQRSRLHECQLCHRFHSIRFCKVFLKMSVPQRRRTVMVKRYCGNCLARSHKTRNCVSSKACFHCGRDHHTLLHLSREREDTLSRTPRYTTSETRQHLSSANRNISSLRRPIYISSENRQQSSQRHDEIPARILTHRSVINNQQQRRDLRTNIQRRQLRAARFGMHHQPNENRPAVREIISATIRKLKQLQTKI